MKTTRGPSRGAEAPSQTGYWLWVQRTHKRMTDTAKERMARAWVVRSPNLGPKTGEEPGLYILERE